MILISHFQCCFVFLFITMLIVHYSIFAILLSPLAESLCLDALGLVVRMLIILYRLLTILNQVFRPRIIHISSHHVVLSLLCLFGCYSLFIYFFWFLYTLLLVYNLLFPLWLPVLLLLLLWLPALWLFTLWRRLRLMFIDDRSLYVLIWKIPLHLLYAYLFRPRLIYLMILLRALLILLVVIFIRLLLLFITALLFIPAVRILIILGVSILLLLIAIRKRFFTLALLSAHLFLC